MMYSEYSLNELARSKMKAAEEQGARERLAYQAMGERRAERLAKIGQALARLIARAKPTPNPHKAKRHLPQHGIG
jgi:hypothetical protein